MRERGPACGAKAIEMEASPCGLVPWRQLLMLAELEKGDLIRESRL
jgi:hypothetical protein